MKHEPDVRSRAGIGGDRRRGIASDDDQKTSSIVHPLVCADPSDLRAKRASILVNGQHVLFRHATAVNRDLRESCFELTEICRRKLHVDRS